MEIIAVNIKSGGGKELLLYLIEYLEKTKPGFLRNVHVDSSLFNEIYALTNNVKSYETNLQKIKLFFKIKKNCLYFGNLPPVFKSQNSCVYLHNPFLVLDVRSLFKQSMSFFVKYMMQQIYIYFFKRNVDIFFCQSKLIEMKYSQKYSSKCINTLPFFDTKISINNKSKNVDFAYVSLAYPHKNHHNLLIALKELSNNGYCFSIYLTVESKYKRLITMIDEINNLGNISIINVGYVSRAKVNDIYSNSRALLFPSLHETFGLPLIEACLYDLDVIASDLPYTHEVLKTDYLFNPLDVNSISCAIKNYITSTKIKPVPLIENKVEELLHFFS